MNNSNATINIPLGAVKPVWRNDDAGTLLVEVPIDAIKEVNEPNTLDEVIAQARIDYAKGDFKSFTDVEDLMKDLRS